MYLFSIRKTIQLIVTNKTTRVKRLLYFLSFFALHGLYISQRSTINRYDANMKLISENTQSLPFDRAITISFFIFYFVIAPLICYYLNSKGDNKNFIERFIQISVPVKIMISILCFIIPFFVNLIIAYFPNSIFFTYEFAIQTIFKYLFNPIIYYLIIFLIFHKISKILNPNNKLQGTSEA